MGNEDPKEFICSETQRIPFKKSRIDHLDWQNSFRAWPNRVKGWINWYNRISARKQKLWDEHDIGQCINLSLAGM